MISVCMYTIIRWIMNLFLLNSGDNQLASRVGQANWVESCIIYQLEDNLMDELNNWTTFRSIKLRSCSEFHPVELPLFHWPWSFCVILDLLSWGAPWGLFDIRGYRDETLCWLSMVNRFTQPLFFAVMLMGPEVSQDSRTRKIRL